MRAAQKELVKFLRRSLWLSTTSIGSDETTPSRSHLLDLVGALLLRNVDTSAKSSNCSNQLARFRIQGAGVVISSAKVHSQDRIPENGSDG